MVTCYLGIGSNLGNRKSQIKSAIAKINSLKETKVLKVSRIIETRPVGGPAGQPEFLNCALKVRTNLSPLTLLKKLKIIEKDLGRKKTVRFGARVIDLDILFYADKIIKRKELVVPHPRMYKRDFVLEPLSGIICR
ncbi:MAG: 2-amino-4-hydroxy-6-hydroxymethyldihydropteridine diphosphokinase [Candidatus Omnitrophica bacterium]|nr:2-amino-4-hydroxy-6-hydroxymethyldihydropteridine diphosphokinase [Candidatus Omnitrophota bacterium]